VLNEVDTGGGTRMITALKEKKRNEEEHNKR